MVERRPAEEALVEFRWDVPADGHEIVKEALDEPPHIDRRKPTSETSDQRRVSKVRSELFLAERTPVGLEIKVRRYNPLVFNPLAKEDPKVQDPQFKLFRSFCDLEPSEESIRKFANSCGMLVRSDVVVPEGRKQLFAGEPLSLWWSEVADMKLAFDLWSALLEENVPFLKTHIHFTAVEGGFVVDCRRGTPGGGKGTSFAFFTIMDTSRERGGRASFLRRGDFRLAAVFAVQDLVRKRLQEHVGASVLYVPERDRFGGGQRSDKPTRETRLPVGLRMVPQNLLGALWLQLAQEIERGTEYRRCKMCPTRMEISLEGHRRNRTTCSDKCRRALQRKREDDARVMRAGGKSIRQIAAALGTEMDHVRAWTAKPKRPRGRPRKDAVISKRQRMDSR